MRVWVGALFTAGLLAQTPTGTPNAPSQKAEAEEGQSGVIYGDDHAYLLSAPPGWVLDNEVWASQGIFAVFYPKGSSVKGNWVAYTRVQVLNPKGLLAGALSDLESMKAENPNYRWTRIEDITTSDKSVAIVFSTSGDSFGNAELLAYIQAPTKIVLINAVTRTPRDLDHLKLPFEALVKSYTWFTDKVNQPREQRRVPGQGKEFTAGSRNS